jgi:hypothetical protein
MQMNVSLGRHKRLIKITITFKAFGHCYLMLDITSRYSIPVCQSLHYAQTQAIVQCVICVCLMVINIQFETITYLYYFKQNRPVLTVLDGFYSCILFEYVPLLVINVLCSIRLSRCRKFHLNTLPFL